MFTGFHRSVHAAEERYRRRGYECGLDARDYQEAAEERFIEEDEDSSCGFNFGLGLKQTFEGERWEKKYENMNGWYMLIWLVVSTCSSTYFHWFPWDEDHQWCLEHWSSDDIRCFGSLRILTGGVAIHSCSVLTCPPRLKNTWRMEHQRHPNGALGTAQIT